MVTTHLQRGLIVLSSITGLVACGEPQPPAPPPASVVVTPAVSAAPLRAAPSAEGVPAAAPSGTTQGGTASATSSEPSPPLPPAPSVSAWVRARASATPVPASSNPCAVPYRIDQAGHKIWKRECLLPTTP